VTSGRVKAAVAALLMALAFAGAYGWRPQHHLADSLPKLDLEVLFPMSFGEWVVDDRMPVQLVAPDVQAMLKKIYSQTLSRSYVNRVNGERVMLSVAYGGDQADATRAHRPEVCYPAQGFQIFGDQKGSAGSPEHRFRVRQLLAKLGGRVEPITYWIVVGKHIALSGTEQKLAQLSYSTRGIIPDGMLVRVSTIDANTARAYQLQGEFIAQITLSMPRAARERVIGGAGGTGG